MHDHIASLYENFSLARTIYSLILVSVIVLLLTHLISIWSAGKISISEFSYFTNGKKDAEHAEQLRSETNANYSMIVSRIKAYEDDIKEKKSRYADNCRGDTGWFVGILKLFNKESKADVARRERECSNENQEGRIDVTTLASISGIQADKLQEVAKTLDISVQGVSLKGFFSAFGNLVAPPQTELIASIYDSDGTKRAYVSVAGDSRSRVTRELTARMPAVSPLDEPGKDGDSAFRIACFLIWMQIQKNSNEFDDQHTSFEEFCDWARILGIKASLEATDPYRMDARKKLPDIDFVKSRIALAALREISFRDTYVSISDMTDLMASEAIKLDDKTEATVDSLKNLLRLFALSGGKDDDTKAPDSWIKSLKNPKDRKAVNEAYFRQFISTDCNPAADLPDGVRAAAANIVAISMVSDPGKVVTNTGWVMEDGQVLVVFNDNRGRVKIADRFKSATVKRVHCGSSETALPVVSAKQVMPTGSPYAILSVPGLKRSGKQPERTLDGADIGTDVFVVGIVPRPQDLFEGVRGFERARTAHGADDDAKETIHFISGNAFAEYERKAFSWDSERFFYLSVPHASGMGGSPILDGSGELLGFVAFGNGIIGDNLLLSVGAAMTSLKDLPSFAKKIETEAGK